MIYKKNLFKLIAAAAILASSSAFPKEQRLLQEKKDMALMQCLRKNYLHLGFDIYKHDRSRFYGSYSKIGLNVDYDAALSEFIEKNTADFYKEEVLIKNEIGAPPPFTAVFGKCMEFYKSKKLDSFVKSH